MLKHQEIRPLPGAILPNATNTLYNLTIATTGARGSRFLPQLLPAVAPVATHGTLHFISSRTVCPVSHSFDNHRTGFETVDRQFANRVLDHSGLAQPGAYHWKV